MFGGVKIHYIGICLLLFFPSFLIDTLFTSVTPSFFRSLFISLMMHKESSLLLTTPLLIFRVLTVMGVKLVDVTFSIMKGDEFVIGALLDSMIMNLGKGVSVSLSEESNSFKLRLNFFVWERSHVCYMFFISPMLHHPPWSPTWEGNEPKTETNSPWLRRGNNTRILILRVRFQASAKFLFL